MDGWNFHQMFSLGFCETSQNLSSFKHLFYIQSKGLPRVTLWNTQVLALIFCIVTVNASQIYIYRNFMYNFSIFLVFNRYFSKWRMCIPRCFKKWNLLYKWRMLGKKWDCEWQLCCWVCQSKYNIFFLTCGELVLPGKVNSLGYLF